MSNYKVVIDTAALLKLHRLVDSVKFQLTLLGFKRG
jgi:hypothetical protein